MLILKLNFPPSQSFSGQTPPVNPISWMPSLVLSRFATERTLADALSAPVRGYPAELFRFPKGGLASLLEKDRAEFALEADLEAKGRDRMRYRVGIEIQPRSGSLRVIDEYLARVSKIWDSQRGSALQIVNNEIHIRRKSKPARPRTEHLGLNHTQLSDARFSGIEYSLIQRVRNELSAFRSYYLDPRIAMRRSVPPKEASDIGPLGGGFGPLSLPIVLNRQETKL